MAQGVMDGSLNVPVSDRRRPTVARRFAFGDRIAHGLTFSAAILVLALLAGVILTLIIGSVPAFREFGFGFFTSAAWNPVTEKFGALAPITGTVMTSALAMLIAVPVSLGIAVFLTE